MNSNNLGQYLFSPVVGKIYSLKVIASGSSLKVYLDNVLVINTTDTVNRSRIRVGLRSSNDDTTSFDNLIIRKIIRGRQLSLSNGWTGDVLFEKTHDGHVSLYGELTIPAGMSNTISQLSTAVFPKAGHAIAVNYSERSEMVLGMYITTPGSLVIRKPLRDILVPGDTLYFNTVFKAVD